MKVTKLLAVALLAPAVALAAPAKSTTTKSSAAARPAPATPAASSSSGSGVQGLEVGGFIGYETADFSGISLRLDGEMPFRDLAPQVKLSLVGSLGYSRLSWDIPFGDVTANLFKIVPAARFTLPLNPQFALFGDAGLGLAYVSVKVEQNVPFFGTVSASDSSLNLMMRLGVGAWYYVNPQLKLGAMLELDPIFGDFGTSTGGVSSQNTFLIQVGGMFKI